jgi:hypothetical protein
VAGVDALVVVVDRDREDLLARSWLMTYWSSASLIWCGLGSLDAAGLGRGVSSISSSMISWQRLMHSSQM